MSDNGDPSENPDTRDPVTPGGSGGPRPLSRWVVAAPSIALVLGMLLGGSLIWVTTNDTSPNAEDERDDDPDSRPSPGTAVVVPDACLEAAETVREATELIRSGLDDIRAFRAEELIDLLNDLEDLDSEARAQAQTCSEVQVTDAPLSSPTAPTAPTTEPSTQVPTDPSASPVESPSS